MVVVWDVLGNSFPISFCIRDDSLWGSCYDSLFLGENESPCAHSSSLLFVFRLRLATVDSIFLPLFSFSLSLYSTSVFDPQSPWSLNWAGWLELLVLAGAGAGATTTAVATASCFVAYPCTILILFAQYPHHESPPCMLSFACLPPIAYTQHTFSVTK